MVIQSGKEILTRLQQALPATGRSCLSCASLPPRADNLPSRSVAQELLKGHNPVVIDEVSSIYPTVSLWDKGSKCQKLHSQWNIRPPLFSARLICEHFTILRQHVHSSCFSWAR